MIESVFAILASTPEKLRRELQDFSAREMKKRPAPDNWSVQEILAHLADVEEHGMRSRVEAIVTEDRPVFEPSIRRSAPSNCATIALIRAGRWLRLQVNAGRMCGGCGSCVPRHCVAWGSIRKSARSAA